MFHHPLPRLDHPSEIREKLLPLCRLQPGEIWQDKRQGHRLGCLDAAQWADVKKLCGRQRAVLAIHDVPYNFIAFEQRKVDEFTAWCARVTHHTEQVLAADSSLYLWLGADQRADFAPLPEIMLMMRATGFTARSFITLRNQRGYGTQQNWMSVRQELLYYTKGKPPFTPQYTDLPKTLRGYFKEVGGQRTENAARGKAPTLRAGNVWIDVQQVFYRMAENVNGCYAQKPLKAITRIIEASSQPGDVVLDFFAHSGTTLLACELTGRRCLTMDIDPLFAEVARRRLEHYRRTGKTGWQDSNPFARELGQI
ncbi:MAG: site-specific DNA-methyltransferase [Acidobacteria bacterium]|nr:site-specific DNA-methyltransferase [Acidobacteriota bacterium]MBI3421345.1 site-specific DNA-methyltransferase [Acidobacteriota bacterium]